MVGVVGVVLMMSCCRCYGRSGACGCEGRMVVGEGINPKRKSWDSHFVYICVSGFGCFSVCVCVSLKIKALGCLGRFKESKRKR